ncbi:biogenesis of lysosome-related organelles complex 1 subunit 5 isoform X5 [Castor canadensis]|uniref:Biogenesis of lysosome-related organelles complex 1 subunit 5 isoform X5 n=1 Tax=Castor canadensis TaxID=51338 RepID=A0AC58NBI3_CASCN
MSGGVTETSVGGEAALGGGGKKRDSLGTSGSAQLIIKDLGEIHSRLLDHRPVIQGETRYFVKEFECKQLMTLSVDSNRGNRSGKRSISKKNQEKMEVRVSVTRPYKDKALLHGLVNFELPEAEVRGKLSSLHGSTPGKCHVKSVWVCGLLGSPI